MISYPTYTYDVDADIASRVDDTTLESLSRVNRYMNGLVSNPESWRRRVENRYGVEYLDKPDDIEWERWYRVWTPRAYHNLISPDPTRRVRFDPIGSRLGLSPREAGIRLLTQDGFVVPSSNGHPTPSLRYQGIMPLMRSAIKANDTEALAHLVSEEIGLELTGSKHLYDRCSIIRYAYKYHHVEVMKPLVELARTEIIRYSAWDDYLLNLKTEEDTDPQYDHPEYEDYNVDTVIESLYQLASAYGYINDAEAYNHLASSISEYFATEMNDKLIEGLLRGGHGRDAMDMIQPWIQANPRWWEKTSRIAELTARYCRAFTPELKALIEAKTQEPLGADFAEGLLRGGDVAGALEYEDELEPRSIVSALVRRDPQGVIIYLESMRKSIREIYRNSISGYLGRMTIDTSNSRLIEYCIANQIRYEPDPKTISIPDYIRYINANPSMTGPYGDQQYQLIELVVTKPRYGTILASNLAEKSLKDVLVMDLITTDMVSTAEEISMEEHHPDIDGILDRAMQEPTPTASELLDARVVYPSSALN